MPPPQFSERYGPWAVVAGASEGLGAAFATGLARRGLNLVLLARRAEPLEQAATRLRSEHRVEVRTHRVDLAAAELHATLDGLLADLDVGLGIYNAAYAPVGELHERTHDELMRVVDVNVRGPLTLAHLLAPRLRTRGHGGLVLMSSLAGGQGSPRLAGYAASKAFNTVLAEGLWGELRRAGVDVIAPCAGAIRTPGYASASGKKDPPGTLDASEVAEQTLSRLRKGPRVTPGLVNKVASLLLGRWLPRRQAVALMAASTKDLS